MGLDVDQLTIKAIDNAKKGIAQADCTLKDRVEYWFDLRGRRADDLENLRSRGLPIERLSEVAVARLHLLKQTRVLHRDQRLFGEGVDECNLALGEGAHGLAEQHYHADRRLILDQRHAEPSTRDLSVLAGVVPGRIICEDVGQVDRLTLERH